MTEKLYNKDSFIFDFKATVLSCEQKEDFFVSVLDKTAFFPEGGGQAGDEGKIGDINVFDTKEECGIIYHYSKEYIQPKKVYDCSIDRFIRFRRMQNHTGEHIVSGIVHNVFGFENVGFHLGKDDMTMDYDRELSKQDIERLEYLANRAVYEDRPVTITYPEPGKLGSISYRSKLDLTEDVRIVTIEGIDCCACCAPHLRSTGMVGIIKITDFIRYKGGVRLHARCGFDALDVFSGYQKSIEKLSALFSAKRHEVYDFAEKFVQESEKKDRELYALKKRLLEYQMQNIDLSKNNVCLFLEAADTDTMREAANRITEKHDGICAVLSGDDESGYRFVLADKNGGVRDVTKRLNSVLCGKGGGSDLMSTGIFKADKASIECNIEKI